METVATACNLHGKKMFPHFKSLLFVLRGISIFIMGSGAVLESLLHTHMTVFSYLMCACAPKGLVIPITVNMLCAVYEYYFIP